MDDESKIPALLQLAFGERASLAQSTASGRLIRWSNAFDKWIGERRRDCPEHYIRASIQAWAELLSQSGKVPWEVTDEDLRQYVEWLNGQGFADSTIYRRLSDIESFYAWCGKNYADTILGAEFNPARDVPKPRYIRYGKAQPLSIEEARDLLYTMRLDESILSKRDYAFFLARLLVGAPLAYLLKLKWGQIHLEAGIAWADWVHGRFRSQLPGEVWGAIKDYLHAAGRLDLMQPGDFIFAPLKNPLLEEASGKAEEWESGRAISARQMTRHLKSFGRLAGIAEEKLTLAALLHTATLLRLEAGDDTKQIQEFLCRSSSSNTRYYLKKLLDRPTDRMYEPINRRVGGSAIQRRARESKSYRFQPFEGLRDGLRAKRQPPQELEAILKEEVKGLAEEIEGLWTLSQRLLGLFDLPDLSAELSCRLAEVYSSSAARLVELRAAAKSLQEADTGSLAEELSARLKSIVEERGEVEAPEIQATELPGSRGEDKGKESSKDIELSLPERRLSEAIAALRLVLRRTFRLAMEVEEPKECIYLTDVYRSVCGRLIMLLKMEALEKGSEQSQVGGILENVLRELLREWGYNV